MMRVTLTAGAARDFERMPLTMKNRMLLIIERLQRWPAVSEAKPLSGPLAGHYRIRTGDYRVRFRLEGGTLVIEKIGHRAGFYED